MKISVLIIGHNEEAYIAECIESVLNQTTKADEVVFVNHNSTDRSGEIARTYPITVIDYQSPRGPAYARIKGIQSVTGDVVLCIDGDAIAAPNWIETLTEILLKPRMVMAGSWIRMRNNLYSDFASMYWYFVSPSKGRAATDFMWGASFGFRSEYKELAIHALTKSIELSNMLDLVPNPEDYWLALYLFEKGNLEVTNKTHVTAYAKEKNSLEMLKRGFIARGIRRKMLTFLEQHPLP